MDEVRARGLGDTHAPHGRVRVRFILSNIIGHRFNQSAVSAAAVRHQIKRPVALAAGGSHAGAAVAVLHHDRNLERCVNADTGGDGAVEEHW